MTGLWLYIRDEANGGALVAFDGGPVWAELYVSPGALGRDFADRPWWRRPQGAIDVSERPGVRE